MNFRFISKKWKMATILFCKFHQTGHCKFGDICKHFHNKFTCYSIVTEALAIPGTISPVNTSLELNTASLDLTAYTFIIHLMSIMISIKISIV